MTPVELTEYLQSLISHRILISAMLWGPPGVGKSSIVAQTARRNGLDFVDVRLSQLAPTDLRGLPVPENGVSRWYPPEFLPTGGTGILFLDELNMAPPALQGIAQQLILDRQVGSYRVPEGWYVWAAGNRKEDRAAVFDMPAPLANRFLHLEITPDLTSFKAYALREGVQEQIIAFLSFRPALLYALSPNQPAWPSPRSWVMASRLLAAGLDIAPTVGAGAASEFAAYRALYAALPDLEPILEGRAGGVSFPAEPSVRYAATIGLTVRADEPEKALNVFRWMADQAPPEWVQLFAADMLRLMRERGQMGMLAPLILKEPRLQQFLRDYQELLRQ
ncbi:ATPase [Capsulimonas corticalis]|uniref:ATPase n=1 Tax=Capsulimonas corticalis TaxID=2219043 RepID=A0A402CPA5_9BACT|nr:MoxR family ATPase [Capsulimonas corticalis]BDI33071.1 ATPase [Capsulimonas corticalis]